MGLAAYEDTRGPVMWQRERAPVSHEPLPQQISQSQATNGIFGAHQPYWRELDQGWHPANGMPQARRVASHSPGPTQRWAPQADPVATLLMPPHVTNGMRPEMGAKLPGGSWLAGSSIENSHLFHTHNASASLDSNFFRTPLAPQPQRASPMATTQRRGMTGVYADAPHASSPPRRARTPPPRPPSMPAGLLGGGLEEEFRHMARQASVGTADFGAGFRGRDPSPQLRPPPEAAHFANSQERRAAFQARIAELKGVIGSSLQSLDEEEAVETQRWMSARATALADREEALRGTQNDAARELAAAVADAARSGATGATSLW